MAAAAAYPALMPGAKFLCGSGSYGTGILYCTVKGHSHEKVFGIVLLNH
jgi:hypothetical protein